MSNDEIRVPRGPRTLDNPPPPPPRRSATPWLILGICVVLIIILLALFRDRLFGESNKSASANEYQAVFLTNGQVYFGKLSEARRDYIRLTDIFYLQVTQPPLQGSQQDGQARPQQQPQLQLVKLGNELHGPMDEMTINKEHVLFFEDLKNDGRVVKAIQEYKANPNRSSGSSNSGTNSQQQTQQQVTPPAQIVAPPPAPARNTTPPAAPSPNSNFDQ